MSSRMLTTLFSTYQLREQLDELTEQLENNHFDDAQIAALEKDLYHMRDKVKAFQQPSTNNLTE